MSLSRVSSLESWEFRPSSFNVRASLPAAVSPHRTGHSDCRTAQSIADPALLSSSFPSIVSKSSAPHRLSFNPAYGPSWTQNPYGYARLSVQRDDEWDERSVDSRVVGKASDTITEGREGEGRDVTLSENVDWLPGKPETISATEVPAGKRFAQICLAFCYCFFSAGIIFGFAALKPILIEDGVYHNLCTAEEIDKGDSPCYGQDIRLNFLFTLAAVGTNMSALPVGSVLDAYGPRVCAGVGSLLLAAGSLLMAFAHTLPFDAYIPGYLFIACGSPFVFISCFHLSNAFPRHSGLILSTITGAFDCSSVVFMIFRLLYTSGIFSMQGLFILYLILPIFILVTEILFMPKASYKTFGELFQQQAESSPATRNSNDTDPNIPDSEEQEIAHGSRSGKYNHAIVTSHQTMIKGKPSGRSTDQDDTETQPFLPSNQEPDIRTSNSVRGAMHGTSAIEQVRSPWFILITIFTMLQMLRLNYFIATIRTQYAYLLNTHLARSLNHTFDFLLPLGGVVAIPFMGFILDNISTPVVITSVVFTSTIIGILGTIPNSLTAAYANISLFVVYRPFYYTCVSDYTAKVFGFQTFGKVYGLLICVAGLGNFMQSSLDVLRLKVSDGDPIPVNIVLTVLIFVFGAFLAIFVTWQARRMGKISVSQRFLPANNSQRTTGVDGALIAGSSRIKQSGYGTV